MSLDVRSHVSKGRFGYLASCWCPFCICNASKTPMIGSHLQLQVLYLGLYSSFPHNRQSYIAKIPLIHWFVSLFSIVSKRRRLNSFLFPLSTHWFAFRPVRLRPTLVPLATRSSYNSSSARQEWCLSKLPKRITERLCIEPSLRVQELSVYRYRKLLRVLR